MAFRQGKSGFESVSDVVNQDPTSGSGVPAQIGTVSVFGGNVYVKTSAANTGWSKLSTSTSEQGVETVTGTGVNNTDPQNPVLSLAPVAVSGEASDLVGLAAVATSGLAKDIATATTTVTLAIAGTNIDFTGLSGDTDGDYLVTFDLIAGASNSGVITVKINDSSANQSTGGLFNTRGASTGGYQSATLEIDTSETAGAHCTGRFFLTSKSGKWRLFDVTAFGGAVSLIGNGTWQDTSTIINKVSIVAATAAGLAIGSTATLQKLFRA